MNQGLENESVEQGITPPVIDPVDVTEKMVKQSDVDKAVKHAKHIAYEQGRKETLMQLQPQPADNNTTADPVNHAPSSLGGMQGMTPEQVQQMITEHNEKQAQQYHAQQIANEFVGKLSTGKDKYPDFAEKMEALDLATIPQVVQLANSVDNTADVMYELANNPNKLVTLINLSNYGNSKLAYLETKKLSDSIKQNQQALQQPIPPEPLSQLTPSNVGTGSDVPSIRDLRKQSYLRV